jgi:hypothetical protein
VKVAQVVGARPRCGKSRVVQVGCHWTTCGQLAAPQARFTSVAAEQEQEQGKAVRKGQRQRWRWRRKEPVGRELGRQQSYARGRQGRGHAAASDPGQRGRFAPRHARRLCRTSRPSLEAATRRARARTSSRSPGTAQTLASWGASARIPAGWPTLEFEFGLSFAASQGS